MIVRVLGVDLASARWASNGTGLLEFEISPQAAWTAARTSVISWPTSTLSPAALADAVDSFALSEGVTAVGLDGPHAWRDPNAGKRPGVGRVCEYDARTPGKTGTFGKCYPGTWLGWTIFSIAVFSSLLSRSHVHLVGDGTSLQLQPLPRGHYYVLECFPTSTWRVAGLKPLPGKSNTDCKLVRAFAQRLQQRFGLALGTLPSRHDDLQGLVAALPAAALMGGPCNAVVRGIATAEATSPFAHRIEGIIWDASPLAGVVAH